MRGIVLCHYCARRFKTKDSLDAHLRQPASYCRTLVARQGTSNPDSSRKHPRLRHSSRRSHKENVQQQNASSRINEDVVEEGGTVAMPDANFDDLQVEVDHHDEEVTANIELTSQEETVLVPPLTPTDCGAFLRTHPNAPKMYGLGKTFLENFQSSDSHSQERQKLLYYPFRSREEWELSLFLLQSDLSMADIDAFLSLSLIKTLGLSIKSAKDLQNRCSILPSGPNWKSKEWPSSPHYPTKKGITLYYRDPIDCLQEIMRRPEVKDHIAFTPYQLYSTADATNRIYTEWLSGDRAWEMQDKLPKGATLLGTILSSDKTSISVMTGGRSAYPLFISLANLSMGYRSKASNNAYLLLALLPIPHYLHPNKDVRSVLEKRLIHECLDFIVKYLKQAAEFGRMMDDPWGYSRHCYTPPAACVLDTPESALYACVGGLTSAITLASYRTFGDPFRHPPRTALTTLTQLHHLRKAVHPDSIQDYLKAAKALRLNGVDQPFWRDWPLAEPSIFLTPEPLHHWHKFFWDHDAKWCIHVVGSSEIDFRFSILQPHTGFRRFSEGISNLKQVTMREHREMQRYIIPIIAGAASKEFVIAIRSLLNFRYLAQAGRIDERILDRLDASLSEFHQYKQVIVDCGARKSKKKAKGPPCYWPMPKLETLWSVGPNTRANGPPMQWSAETTERAHITSIKEPARASNNQRYEEQICRYLDRQEKCTRFNNALNLMEGQDAANGSEARTEVDYFSKASILASKPASEVLLPRRTFSVVSTAFHLTSEPSTRRTKIEDIATLYHLPDLKPALQELISRLKNENPISVAGRRRVLSHEELPFTHLEAWRTVRVQTREYFWPHTPLTARTISAIPPCTELPYGQSDGVIINIDPSSEWPNAGLKGHQVVLLKAIFRIVAPLPSAQAIRGLSNQFLAYVERFDIVPQANPSFGTSLGPYPECSTSLFMLKKATRASYLPMGDVVFLSQLRTPVDLVPRFRTAADPHLTSTNMMHLWEEFWLNSYFDRNFFYALTFAAQ